MEQKTACSRNILPGDEAARIICLELEPQHGPEIGVQVAKISRNSKMQSQNPNISPELGARAATNINSESELKCVPRVGAGPKPFKTFPGSASPVPSSNTHLVVHKRAEHRAFRL